MTLTALFIAIPLLLAFLAPAFGKKMGSLFGVVLPAILSLQFVAAIWVFLQVQWQGSIQELIVIAPPLGIHLVADSLSSLLVLLFSGAAWWSSFTLLSEERRTPAFFSLFVLHLVGLNAMILTRDIFNLFVFFEITSISGYVLTAWKRNGNAERKALHYLLMGSVASALFLIAIAFLYRHTGSLHYEGIAMSMESVPSAVRWLILGLLLVAWGVETEWFPLNSWVSGVYEASPGGVSAVMGSATVKASLIVFVKIALLLFPNREALPYFVGFGLVTLVVGELAALKHRTLLGTLALGSAAQLGFLSVAILQPNLQSASIFHILSHSFAILILVGIAAAWAEHGHQDRSSLQGLARRNPWIGFWFTVAAFSAIGFPPFMGFVGKLAILQGLSESPLLVGIVLLASLIEAWYLGEILIQIWSSSPAQSPATKPRVVRFWLLLPGMAIPVFGLWPMPILQFLTGVNLG